MKMRNFQTCRERYTRLHDGDQQSLRAVIQVENRDSPLENPHREKKILEVANSQLQV
ncbi:MAG: hypothetical protein V4700_03040 [Pseudomonadota bacterium]